jgi:hypothetical protein
MLMYLSPWSLWKTWITWLDLQKQENISNLCLMLWIKWSEKWSSLNKTKNWAPFIEGVDIGPHTFIWTKNIKCINTRPKKLNMKRLVMAFSNNATLTKFINIIWKLNALNSFVMFHWTYNIMMNMTNTMMPNNQWWC